MSESRVIVTEVSPGLELVSDRPPSPPGPGLLGPSVSARALSRIAEISPGLVSGPISEKSRLSPESARALSSNRGPAILVSAACPCRNAVGLSDHRSPPGDRPESDNLGQTSSQPTWSLLKSAYRRPDARPRSNFQNSIFRSASLFIRPAQPGWAGLGTGLRLELHGSASQT